MGQSIVTYAKEQGIELSDYESFKAFPGQGIRAAIHGAFIRVGKRIFLEHEGVQSELEITTEADRLEREGKTVVWVSRETQILGIIALMDTPKDDAQNA